MVSAGDFKNGITLEIDGTVYQILEFQHVKPGKGAAFVRTKLKNIVNGGVVEKTFRPTEKFPQARIDRVDMQYLYNDGDLFYFMNVETYDQVALNEDTIGDALKFVKDNEMVKVCSINGDVFAVATPGAIPFRRWSAWWPTTMTTGKAHGGGTTTGTRPGVTPPSPPRSPSPSAWISPPSPRS